MRPTHVIFFGYCGLSIEPELPDVFRELYPNGQGDSSQWKNTVKTIENSGVHYIFSYHSNWGYRKSDYERQVVESLNRTI